MIRPIRLNPKATEAMLLKLIGDQLADMYSNKSSEEYKMGGDITKSTTYEKINIGISELKSLKGFNKHDAEDMKTMFLTLHRPIFKKMITEYIAEPGDRNTVFTAVFTVGYRVLVAELSRIMASTESTPKGIVYKPDKISKNQDMSKFIKYMNSSIETVVDEEINKAKSTKPEDESIQEAFAAVAGAGAAFAVAGVAGAFVKNANALASIFRGLFKFGNPLATISAILNNNIEKNVTEYENTLALYESTKQAYQEYLKTPESLQKKTIKKKYETMINKYNMRVNKLKAKIAHYDQRSNSETEDSINKLVNDNKDTKSKPSNDDTNDDSINF